MTKPSDIRPSSQIRQDFLDFFKSKQHTIVPSSSLMPDSPNLLFTNAGMNQFVPIFLGQVKCPYQPPRAADTQKCIRAGGKHNDLDDVGLDTYHHTFFEMLGNWSFGDYFKKEAIDWAWELITDVWKFPKERLYATVFCPDLKLWQQSLDDAIKYAEIRLAGGKVGGLGDEVIGGAKGSGAINWPDEEAASYWAEHFLKAKLDPRVQIVPGNRKDNFWMMGETGPCGPCSELHVDLTPLGDTKGSLVNKGDARCIEIWNLVFIQFNAEPGEKFSLLPAKHVDTGMGFERVTSIIQGTKNFQDFANAKISNYETDIFRPIFDALQTMSRKEYRSSLPTEGRSAKGHDLLAHAANPQIPIDIAFRVIADHIRTLSFAIADGIQPGNTDRNYVLRRILRRAVRYGRTLGFHEPFFYKLVDVLAEKMGHVFPEIRVKQGHVKEVIRLEEEAFNKTVDEGSELELQIIIGQNSWLRFANALESTLEHFVGTPDRAAIDRFRSSAYGNLVPSEFYDEKFYTFFDKLYADSIRVLKGDYDLEAIKKAIILVKQRSDIISGNGAFTLYDTFGFPYDLIELTAREHGMTVDKVGFEKSMEEQRTRARAAQKKEVILLSQIETTAPTQFVGFDQLDTPATVLEIVSLKEKPALIVNASPFYAEMGGQVGDTGQISFGGQIWPVTNTQKSGNVWLHFVNPGGSLSDDLIVADHKAGNVPTKYDAQAGPELFPSVMDRIELSVNKNRRDAIQRHHTVTHLLHWALHEVVSRDASQKGSFVGPDKLTFDFNSPPLTPAQVSDVEKLVNERILENAGVSWTEVPYADVKSRKDVMQFFGDKYGDRVRVVQIGGQVQKLDGYSMELCGGTHTRATGEIGLFRIVGESAIAAGVRRIEAVAGLEAYRKATDELHLIKTLAGRVNSPVHELEKKIEAMLAQQKELEKQLKSAQQREASNAASELLGRVQTVNGTPVIIHNAGAVDGDFLQAMADSLKGRFEGVVVLGGASGGAVALVASVSADFTGKFQAGKIIQAIAPIVGGKGGGKPDNARGGGKDAGKLDEALAKAKSLLG